MTSQTANEQRPSFRDAAMIVFVGFEIAVCILFFISILIHFL